MAFDQNEGLQISEIMTRKPVIVKAGTTIKKAAETMKRFNVGSMPVMKGKKVVGFFTGDDMVFKVLAQGLDSTTTKVDDIMVKEIISVTADQSVKQATEV